MEFDPHERARLLTSEAWMAEIAAEGGRWLEGHIAECAVCARYREEIEGVVGGLRSFGFEVDPAMTGRVLTAVAARTRRHSAAPWWVALAAALAMAATIPVYRYLRETRREKTDELLMERVESGLGRVVPVAMEPLVQIPAEETK